MHLMLSRRITKVEHADMAHATPSIITVHTDRALVGRIIHIHHDGFLARELFEQLLDECLYVKYAAQIANRGLDAFMWPRICRELILINSVRQDHSEAIIQ
ncbi:hypothetical protein EE612_007652 [Oryza sativa]|nr:hypothetical protein EE612_007652 [Oryza sativa]